MHNFTNSSLCRYQYLTNWARNGFLTSWDTNAFLEFWLVCLWLCHAFWLYDGLWSLFCLPDIPCEKLELTGHLWIRFVVHSLWCRSSILYVPGYTMSVFNSIVASECCEETVWIQFSGHVPIKKRFVGVELCELNYRSILFYSINGSFVVAVCIHKLTLVFVGFPALSLVIGTTIALLIIVP